MQTKLELYQLVTPLAGLGIWERNLKTGEAYWNSIIRQILEVEEGYLSSLEDTLLFYKNPQLVRDLINRATQTRNPESVETELITAKGNIKHVKIRMQADYESNTCVRMYGTLENITHEISLRQQAEELQQRFFQAFTYAPIGMALVSLTGQWMKVNHSLCNLLGYSEEELLQQTFQVLTHPDDLETDLLQMQQLLANEILTYSMEKRYFHKKGYIIWALLNVSVVRDDAGKPLYFVSQVKDITESRKLLETVKQQNNRLLNFAHIVSHNLRSHTGNIQMLTDMIIGEKDPVEKEELTWMLHKNAGNLLETLSHLNEVVKIHDNGLSNRQNIYLLEELNRVLNILSGSIMAAEAVVNIDIHKNTSLLFDPAYLESILINLVTNAVRYRDPNRPLVLAISATEAVDRTVLQIADNGLGIDLRLHAHKLFGMYKTFHGNEDARGMGLFMVKNQVEAMGGRISAESEPGTGTTFTIEFTKIKI